MVSSVTVAVRFPPDQVTVWPPGLAVTKYPVIVDPPVDDGAVQVMVAWVSPAVAETLVGVPGTVTGVTGLEAEEAALLPLAFAAVTVNV